MHHFETWEHSWHYFPATICLIIFLIMMVSFFYFYKKRRVFFNSSWSWDWFADCYSSRSGKSGKDILKKRYASGEINKDVFEQMQKDISDSCK